MIRALLFTFLLLCSFTSYSQVQYVVSTLAGGREIYYLDGLDTNARFSNPTNTCVDAAGNVYVASSNRIRKITPSGVVSTLAGSGFDGDANGTGTNASFYQPHGVAVDSSGNLYVADSENNRIRKITPLGLVTTLAGSNSAGYLDGNGTNARFNYPTGVAVDAFGNVYVADTWNYRIRKITPLGEVTTLAGSGIGRPDMVTGAYSDGIGTAASFFSPSGLAVDASGNVFVADTYNNRIRKITPSGEVTTIAGSGEAGYIDSTGNSASFNYPTGVAVNASGDVYVADAGNHRIRKISSLGVVTTVAGSGQRSYLDGMGTLASFRNPSDVSIDASGSIYVADSYNHCIRKISASRMITTFAGSGNGRCENRTGVEASFNDACGIALDASRNIFVADGYNRLIRKVTSTGVVTTFAGSGNSGDANGTGVAASFALPVDVAVDVNDNIYVVDFNRIRKITPMGVVTTFAGAGNFAFADGIGTAASFNQPQGIAIDASGNVYVADTENHRIRKITPSGVVSTLAGSGNAAYLDGLGASSSFNKPCGIAVDATGNVYVADTYNHRIRKITPSGVVTTLAGSGFQGNIDGISTNASFSYPSSLIIDASGNIFVANGVNYKIRKISPSGVVTTLSVSSNSDINYGDGPFNTLSTIAGLSIDYSGTIYFSDGFKNSVRKMKPCNVTRSNISLSICIGSSYLFGNQTLSTSGTYTNIIPNKAGCDSVITLNLTVTPPLTSSISFTICRGARFLFGTQTLSSAGTYYNTVSNSAGCDSIIRLNLNVLLPSRSAVSHTICAGSSYIFGGRARTISGNYYDTLTNSIGCDSIIILSLTVNPATASSISRSICTGSSYVFGGIARNRAGIYKDTIANVAGCDSIITLNLIVNPVTVSSISRSICAGSSYFFGGIARTRAGIYKDTILNAAGCDSIITLRLTINPATASSITTSLCDGKKLNFGSQLLTSAGTYTNTVPNAEGCDSTITLNLTVNLVSTSASLASICEGSLFTFAGVNLNTTGVYVDSSKNKYGCDSVAFLDLRINPIPAAPAITQRKDTLFATTNGDRFQWYKGDTLLKNDTLSYLKTNYKAGYYKVITSKNSCNSPFSPAIKISANNKLVSTLRIFPNPASLYFTIEVTNPTTVQVLNLLGQVVISQTVIGKTDINTAMLSIGTYVVLAEGFDATRLVVSK